MVLWVIIILTFLEVSFYISYVLRPFDKTTGKGISLISGLPKLEDIFSQTQLSKYIVFADGEKTLYPERVDEYLEDLAGTMVDSSSFVKSAEANYVVAGTVLSVKNLSGQIPISTDSYEISLKNQKGGLFKEILSPTEAQYAKVYLDTLSPSNTSREGVNIKDIKSGNYITIKRTTNLLNPAESRIEIDILSTGK